MSVDGMTVNLTASAAIAPYRAVKVSGIYTGAAAASATDIIVGITDGSTPSYSNTTNNAEIGDPINCQQGPYVQVQTGAAVTAADPLMPTTAGKMITATGAGACASYVALQTAGAADEFIWAYRGTSRTFTS